MSTPTRLVLHSHIQQLHNVLTPPESYLPLSLSTTLAILCPASYHTPPVLHLILSELHRLHQIPHAQLLAHFSVPVSCAIVVRCRAVKSTVVFGQSDQTNHEGCPVFDGGWGECPLVLAEFDGARFSYCNFQCQSMVFLTAMLAQRIMKRV